MRKAILLAFLLLFLSFFAVLSVTSAQVDWWPMFHHDPLHTGYSTSAAPNMANVIWDFQTGAGVTSSPAIVDGKVYFGSYDYSIYCLDMDSGNEIWNHAIDGRVYGGPAVVDGRVYIGGYNPSSNFYCLDASTGNEIWIYTMGGFTQGSPVVADGRVYIGSNDGNLYCLDSGDGSLIWSYTTRGGISSSPALADNRVYFGSVDSCVYCLNAGDGNFIWSYTTGNRILSSPTVGDGKVYIGSNDYNAYCLDAETGNFIWSFTTGGSVGCVPALAYNRVYISSTDANIYCLDALTGNEMWSYTMGSMTYSGPSIAGGKVFVGSNDNKLYCFDALVGNLIWDYTTGHTLSRTSPSIADGKVFVGSYDGKIYCFGNEISIGMNPDNPPVIVPAGGRFTYEGFLCNNTNELLTVDVWVDVYLQPAGPRYGPLAGWLDLEINAGDTISYYPVYQWVHHYAPVGIFDFTAYCGDIQYQTVIDQTSFEVTVTALTGNEPKNGWFAFGWDDNTSVDHIPIGFALEGNYPNPFNVRTNISFNIPKTTEVVLDIYNLLGQKVETLVDGNIKAGYHSTQWDASHYSSGIYFYKLTAGDKVFTKRMTLLK